MFTHTRKCPIKHDRLVSGSEMCPSKSPNLSSNQRIRGGKLRLEKRVKLNQKDYPLFYIIYSRPTLVTDFSTQNYYAQQRMKTTYQ